MQQRGTEIPGTSFLRCRVGTYPIRFPKHFARPDPPSRSATNAAGVGYAGTLH